MTAILNKDGTLAITAMSLVEFLPEVEQAIHNGFTLNLGKNEGVPQQFGTMLVLTMYPAGDVQVQDTDEEDDSKFVITPKTELSKVTQPAGEEHEKALQAATDDNPLVNALPPIESPVQKVIITDTTISGTDDFGSTQKVVQQIPVSTEVVQPVKVDGRRKKS